MIANNARTLFVLIIFAVFFSLPGSNKTLLAASCEVTEKSTQLKIVIDPGHGGKAPGGLGPHGEKEKEITLEVGKILAKRLSDEGMEVLLTRDNDAYIPLEERTSFANKHNADLFISIHVNATDARYRDGVETYFLNLTTDASSNKVAEQENAMSSSSMQGIQLIIKDLMLNAKINESSRFATFTQNAVISSLRKTGYTGKNLGVKQAPFYVLMGAKMPAILIEMGFITNASDCLLLHNNAHLEAIVEGIMGGIRTFAASSSYVYNNGVHEDEGP
jgi:N-acetylmuramoyl-L-alanine amidase